MRDSRRYTVPTLLAALPLGFGAPTAAQNLDPTLVRAQCEVVHDIEDQSILYGLVIDGRSDLPLPGSTVHLAWVTRTGSDSVFHETRAEATEGAFIFCDVPQDTPLTAWAEGFGTISPAREFVFEGGESTRHDVSLTLRRVQAGLSGVITDATTGRPVVGATLTIVGTNLTGLTDDDGRFHMRDVDVGSHELRVEHVAYGEPLVELTVAPGQTTHIEARLDPRPIALEPISVEVSMRPGWLESNGFYRRRARSLGYFISPEDIARRPWARFGEVLRTVPGMNLRAFCSPHCSYRIEMAGNTLANCFPTFYVDGRRINVRPKPVGSPFEPTNTFDLDAITPGHDLAAVEVYRGISETPPQFYGRCGSIVIWTKRGVG